MRAHVVDLATYRRTGKIAPPVQIVYDDVRIEFARRVERRLYEMEAAMRGDCTRPCDSEGPEAA